MSHPRERMIELLRSRGIRDERVLEAMRVVPREEFVPPPLRPRAWDDGPLPIEYGQTISQPLVVAWMTELLELQGDERVLEVGTGSGYQTAILARLAREIVSVERIPELSATAGQRLARLGVHNVELIVADGSQGWEPRAPYDAVLVAAGAPQLPQPLYDQLRFGGRLVVPIGAAESQEMQRIRRTGHGPQIERLGGCRFVPLIGLAAWPSDVPS